MDESAGGQATLGSYELDLVRNRSGPSSLPTELMERLELKDGDAVLVEAVPKGDKRQVVRWWFYSTSGQQVNAQAWLWKLAEGDRRRYGPWMCEMVGVIPAHPGKRETS